MTSGVNNDEQGLEQIKADIAAEAEAARRRPPVERGPDPAPLMTSTNAQEPRVNAEAPVAIAEIAAGSGPHFVDRAYTAILRRPPDPAGFAHQMRVLGAGASKIEVLGDLRYSSEGRRVGARVPGLAPRYVLAKLGRLPLIGYLVRWCVAFAGLPILLGQQRAAEASVAVRFAEAGQLLADLQRREDELRAATERLREALETTESLRFALEARHETLQHRVATLETYSPEADMRELRHQVLAMNHWVVSVRQAIDAIETQVDEGRSADDEFLARLRERAEQGDPAFAQRIRAWVDWLAGRVRDDAFVLDLCGGPRWLDELGTHAWTIEAVETNSYAFAQARERGIGVSLIEPVLALSRTEGASADAVTAVTPDALPLEPTPLRWLREAHRVLKPDGVLMLGDVRRTHASNGTTWDADALQAAARAAGFERIDVRDDGGGSFAILAQRR